MKYKKKYEKDLLWFYLYYSRWPSKSISSWFINSKKLYFYRPMCTLFSNFLFDGNSNWYKHLEITLKVIVCNSKVITKIIPIFFSNFFNNNNYRYWCADSNLGEPIHYVVESFLKVVQQVLDGNFSQWNMSQKTSKLVFSCFENEWCPSPKKNLHIIDHLWSSWNQGHDLHQD